MLDIRLTGLSFVMMLPHRSSARERGGAMLAMALLPRLYENVVGGNLRAQQYPTSNRYALVVTSCSGAGQDQEEASVSGRRATLMAAAAMVPSLLMGRGRGLAQAIEEEPKLDQVRSELRKVISKGKAAGILRLVFHDAGTFNVSQQSGGMNGSIIYELERPENAGLERSVKVLNKARAMLEPAAQVSWADLIAVAGSEAIKICGGPTIPLKLGRLDSGIPDSEGELPSENLDVKSLKQNFQRKGLSTQEMVVLSGAHTIGNKGFGDPNTFDNSYYDILLKKPWSDPGNKMAAMVGLPSDKALVDDDECLHWLELYKKDQAKFFTDFSAAYLKLIELGAKW